ncbi:MAG: bifunctional diaminohydroxyphosphoribosylaminopyrimidine deaminase/5-amino-6-(5-phosphoribosylamino)uracil reductase RibD [Candidatus Dormibacteria bacterium]
MSTAAGDLGGDPMARALILAQLGRGRTSPNPMVGAVLTRDGSLVGEGHHARAGSPHAEVVALEQAGERARGATLWVTLEPCCHTGRTGACTKRLLEAGVSAVQVATLDPNPKVHGRGVAELRAAGVAVSLGEREAEARALIREFAVWVTQGRPAVTLKIAMSLDGKVASAGGESQWITSEASRARAHQLRSEHDAVMVGLGTVLADDPRLTARGVPQGFRQPLRVIVDSQLRTPATARVLTTEGAPVVVATTADAEPIRARALSAAGAELMTIPSVAGRVSLPDLLRQLGEREVLSLLVEGGPTLLGSFWGQRLGDRIAAFVAPLLLGGTAAPGPVGGQGAATLTDGWRLGPLRAEPLGADLLLTAEV